MLYHPDRRMSLSVVIPTLERGPVLIETVEHVLRLPDVDEIVIVDQTAEHPPEIAARLQGWEDDGTICWLRLAEPSVPVAMNTGLAAAKGELVLFLDDDIVPAPGLARAHRANYADPAIGAVVGQVLQPWHDGPADLPPPPARSGVWADMEFPFHGIRRASVANCMAGNLSVRREAALDAGGFDEGFFGAAYRFETEFARRFRRSSGLDVIFDPEASIRHLKVARGGTRVHGEHHGNRNLAHLHGQYYLGWCEARGGERWRYFGATVLNNLTTGDHLRSPWRLPGTLIAQVLALLAALRTFNARWTKV